MPRSFSPSMTEAERLAAGFKPMPPIPPNRQMPKIIAGVVAGVVVLASAGFIGWKLLTAKQVAAPRATIAVLPFQASAQDGDAGWLADVIGEDLTLELSRVPGAKVVAFASTQSYTPGAAVDIGDIGRELGVRYIVAGSVVRQGETVSLRLRLADTKDGALRWSEKIDTPLGGLRGAEATIAERMAQVLQLKVAKARGGKPPPGLHPEAEEFALQGWAAWNKGTPADADKAKALALKALEVDDRAVVAWKTLAAWHLRARDLQTMPTEEAVAGAAKAAERAKEIDADQALVNALYGATLVVRGKHDEARAPLEREIDTNSSHPLAYHYLGLAHLMAGRAVDAAEAWQRAIAVSPRDPRLASFRRHLAMAYLHAGKLPEARTLAQDAVKAKPNDVQALAMLAAVCSAQQEAQCVTESSAALRAAAPDFDIAKAEAEWPPALGGEFEKQHAGYVAAVKAALQAP